MKEVTIEDLALKKSFSDLLTQEKQFVISKISETEYNDIRFLLTSSILCFKNDLEKSTINTATKNHLSIVFNQKLNKQKTPFDYTTIWMDYKKIINPVLSIGIVIIAIVLTINHNMFLTNDSNNVTSILKENKALLKINTKHSSELIDGNTLFIDSIVEINNHLRIKTEGLYVN